MFIRDSFMHIHVTPQAIKRFLSVLFVFICFSNKNHLRRQICRPYGMYSAQLDFGKRGKTRKTGKKGGMSCYEIEHPTDGNREECQDFSKENLFTDLRQSGTKMARTGALFGSR